MEATLKRKNIGTRIISTFIRWVLTLVHFAFNCQEYLQIKGFAMETNVQQATQIYLWVSLKKDTYTLLSEHCLNFTCDS